jgi:hypothetical protein
MLGGISHNRSVYAFLHCRTNRAGRASRASLHPHFAGSGCVPPLMKQPQFAILPPGRSEKRRFSQIVIILTQSYDKY